MPESAKPAQLFISYAHADEPLRKELEKHLAILRRQGLVSVWSDREIGAGTEWRGRIDAMLMTAQMIILLISPDYIASDYCWDVELKRALERHERGEARVIPIILRPTDWKDAPFSKLQALPRDAKPVSEWPSPDAAFFNIVDGLRKVIAALSRR